MATAGKVAPTPKDKFVNGTAYDKLDVVEYNGTLYIAKKASAGVLPDDPEYWMLAVDLTGKLDTTGDTENNTVTFESGDEADPTAWKNVATLTSKEKHSSLLKKISTMFSNVRYLYKLLGTTDISALGSVTEAIATISGNVGNMKGISSSAAITTEGEYALDAREKNASVEGTLANQIDVLNSNFENVDTLNVFYYTSGDMTDMINNYCNRHPYIFGYSQELNDIGIGYFSLVITMGVMKGTDYFFQIAIGNNGKTATRAYSSYNDILWTDWRIL